METMPLADLRLKLTDKSLGAVVTLGQLCKCSVVYLPQENRKNDVGGCQGDEDAAGHLGYLPDGRSSVKIASDRHETVSEVPI